MNFDDTNEHSFELHEVVEIDTICEKFDREWNPQQTLTISKLVIEVEPHLRSTLFHELLLTDLEKRQQHRCQQPQQFYLDLFSEFEAEVLQTSEEAFKTGAGPLDLKIGRFEIREEIGKGGMGHVFRAYDSELKRSVAIKTLHASKSADPGRIKRFRTEITSIANLSHPNIVTLHDVVYQGDATYAVMELLDGEDLAKRLRSGKVSLTDALEISASVADGLTLAHEKGIVHRDIKPANIFLTDDGLTKILDFGIARLKDQTKVKFGDTGSDTGVGTVIGTADYMSPEQVRGNQVDARSDIFSLGVVLYEMVTGRKAFGQTLFADTQAAILKDEPDFEPADRLPPALETVIRRCLQKELVDRYQSTTELKQALCSIEPTEKQLRQTFRPTLGIGLSLAGLAIALVLFAGWFWKTDNNPGSEDSRFNSLAVLPFLGEVGEGSEKESLTFSLTNSLSQLDGLIVRPFSLVYPSYQDRDTLKMHRIAKDLKVDAVITGVVSLKNSDELSIHVELIDPTQSQLIWGGDYTGKTNELLTVGSTIAADIAAILGKSTESKIDSNTSPLTNNLDAFEQYVLGQVALSERQPESVNRALQRFQNATNLDPFFESAYVGVANCFIVQSERNVINPNVGYETARRFAQTALDINKSSVDAQISMAMIEFEFDWNFESAEERFRRALHPANVADADEPRSVVHHPTGHQWFAEFLSAMGRYEEALVEISIAQEQEPTSAIIESIEGLIHLKAGKFDRAIERLTLVLDKYPNFDRARGYLIDVFEVTNQIDKALIQWTALANTNQAPIDHLKKGFSENQDKGYWQQRLKQDNELNKIRAVSPLFRAHAFCKTDKEDQAIELIETLINEHNGALAPNLLVHPFFDSLRGQPKFQLLLKQMGFKAFKS